MLGRREEAKRMKIVKGIGGGLTKFGTIVVMSALIAGVVGIVKPGHNHISTSSKIVKPGHKS